MSSGGDRDPRPPAPRKGGLTRDLLTYVVGGIIGWGLIGLLLDFLLHTRWIWVVGAALGAAAGWYLALLHRKTRAEGRGRHGDP